MQIPLAETEVVGVCSAAVELREAFVRLRIRGFAQRHVGLEEAFSSDAVMGGFEYVGRALCLRSVKGVLRPQVDGCRRVESSRTFVVTALRSSDVTRLMMGKGGVLEVWKIDQGAEIGIVNLGFGVLAMTVNGRSHHGLDLGFLPLVRFWVFFPDLAQYSYRLAPKRKCDMIVLESGDG